MLPRDHAKQICLHDGGGAPWFAGVCFSNIEMTGFPIFN
jgi:hypothetical protein